jgi:hypothetical protein
MARFSASLLILLATVVVATASSRTLLQAGACSSVFDLVSTNPELTTLKAVIEAAGLEGKTTWIILFIHFLGTNFLCRAEPLVSLQAISLTILTFLPLYSNLFF